MNSQQRNVRRIVRDIAHARAGDKGNTSNVNVWVYDPADYDLLRRTLTPERIKREFLTSSAGMLRGTRLRISTD